MKKLSIIFRMYIGFGFLCSVILLLGGANWLILNQTTERVESMSEDAFAIQTRAAEIATESLRLGKQVLDMTGLESTSQVDQQYEGARKQLSDLQARLGHFSEHAERYGHAAGLKEPLEKLHKDLGQLSSRSERMRDLLTKKLERGEAVRNGLSALLLASAEMKQTVSQQSRSKAAKDIYLSELVTTVMNQFSNVEFLLLKMINTRDAGLLEELVENIRFNTNNFNLDMADLQEDVPELVSIKQKHEEYLAGINSEDGIVSQYFQYRQDLSLIDQEVKRLSDMIGSIDNTLSTITRYGENQVTSASNDLRVSAETSNTFTLGILAAALLTAVIISLLLARLIRRPLKETLGKVGMMANGDFSSPMESDQSGEFRQLASSVNQLIESTRTVLSELNQSTIELAGVSDSNQQVADQVRERLGQQNQEITSVATAVTQMEAAIAEVARNTVESQDLANAVEEEVNQGQNLMNKNLKTIDALDGQMLATSDGVSKLASSSQSIGSIITVIEEIAEKTNLLALNAAIEAARAGEQGRGFAVVADEVRELASRTSNSTESIRDMISELKRDADQAVTAMQQSRNELDASKSLIQESSTAMNTIGDSMDKIRAVADQVSTAMQEQQHVATEVTENINVISSVANDNFSQIEILAENGGLLQNQTLQIEQIVQRFKI